MKPIAPLVFSIALSCLAACGADRPGDEEAVPPEAMSPSIDGDAIPPVQTSPRFGPEGADPDMDADEYSLSVATQGSAGPYLVDSRGHPVYVLEGKTDGSACTGACLDAWPPLLRTSLPEAGEGIDAAMVGTMRRDDNTMQLTYSGMPLHYYAKDTDAGPPTGHDVHDQWGGWYLLNPQGERLPGDG